MSTYFLNRINIKKKSSQIILFLGKSNFNIRESTQLFAYLTTNNQYNIHLFYIHQLNVNTYFLKNNNIHLFPQFTLNPIQEWCNTSVDSRDSLPTNFSSIAHNTHLVIRVVCNSSVNQWTARIPSTTINSWNFGVIKVCL